MKKITFLAFFIILLSFLGSCHRPKAVESADTPRGWQLLETPSSSSLRGLSPLTEEIAWASGSEGTWLRTLDGGTTWTEGVVGGSDTADFRGSV